MGRAIGSAPDSAGSVGCVHCGLPVRLAAGEADAPVFCCYGCELAFELAADAGRDHSRTKSTLTFGLLLTMSVMMLSLFLYAEDIYGATDELAWLRTFYRFLSGALATPVMFLCGWPLAKRAIRQTRRGVLSMSALIVVAASAAYALSAYGLFVDGATYFESATAALVLATLGRYLEASARTHASGIVGPAVSRPLEPVRMSGRPITPAEIRAGFEIEIAPEQVVPVDITAKTTAEIDVGVLTGESSPIVVAEGDRVPAGALVIAGPLLGVAQATVEDSTLAQLDRLAKSVRDRSSPLLRWADRFAELLTPGVFLIAGVTWAYWTATADLGEGVVNALAVILVACPCTYAIGAPLVVWLTMQRALKRGVLVRHARAIEHLAVAGWVGFDKTGTLTSDDLSVSGPRDPEILALVRALEDGTKHPVGRALLAFAGEGPRAALHARRVVPGVGIEAEDQHGPVTIGGLGEEIGLARNGEVIAAFQVEEHLRDGAETAVRALEAGGLDVSVLSGDSDARVARIADTLGISFSAGLSPEDKVEHIEVIGKGRVMVGDGLNDAPALAGAAVGIAMPNSSGLARGLAQINLQRPDLTLVPWLLRTARETVTRVRVLLIGSTIYNLGFLALAATGTLRPVWAGLSMLIPSLVTLLFAVGGQDD